MIYSSAQALESLRIVIVWQDIYEHTLHIAQSSKIYQLLLSRSKVGIRDICIY